MSNFFYFLIFSGSVINSGPMSLPESYKNISNFYSLENNNSELLKDLAWSGNPEEGFWKSTYGEMPITGSLQKISSSVTLNVENKTCLTEYFVVDMTPEEIAAKNKQDKQLQFDEAITTGYNIPNTSIYLKMGNEDRIAWNQLLSLLNELLNINQITVDTLITIADKNGVIHKVTVTAAKQYIVGLGFYYYQLWTQLNST